MAQFCEVCTTADAKYKCPTCRVPYCSIVCYKKHKDMLCKPKPLLEQQQMPLQATPAPAIAMGVDEEDLEKIKDEEMDVLKTSDRIKEMLLLPAITQMLKQIDSSHDKIKTLELALLDPTFAKFMYQALDEVVPSK
ncbi:uncharacterized protein CCR75_002944 [Bremia lactucae]|uniref:HIT-type domain-containing protein n=1 Tax=Bremia lactucae TaxID=4779 RepID=A0A976NZS3_BRELC|nr:hypothetical protein CCR75_002944 [Bremia lactucae]